MKEIMDYLKKSSASDREYLIKLWIEYNTRVSEYIDVRNEFSSVEESIILNYIEQIEYEIERVKNNLQSQH